MADLTTSLVRRWWYLLILAWFAKRALSLASQREGMALVLTFIVALGMAMNVLVIVLNDGMPVAAREAEIPEDQRARCKPMGASTRLAFLADWISVRDFLISPGDLLIAIGGALIILQLIFHEAFPAGAR